MSDSESLPSDIEESATQVVSMLLPEKSKIKYEQAYERLRKWCDEKKIKNEANEKVLLVYFENISKRYKPSSLWAYYSMIRAMISIKKNVDISKFIQLVAFLKRQSEGYKPKKSNILTKQHITRFLQEADDDKWLLTKVVLIFGIGGACRKEELTYMLVTNVRNEGQVFCVTIPKTKTKISREFVITSGGIDGINFVDIIKKYMALRPHNAVERFFVGYRNGKCIKQPVGINTIGSMPKNIASFLKLPNANEYTGHCFRKSSTSLLANSGADLLTIKRHGGWKSNTVAEGYIETSVENKKRIATNILGEKNVLVEASTSNRSSLEISKTEMSSGIHLNKCKRVIINVHK